MSHVQCEMLVGHDSTAPLASETLSLNCAGHSKGTPYEPSKQEEEDEEEDLAELELEEDAAGEAEAAAQDDDGAAELAKKRRRHSNRVRADLTALPQSSYDALSTMASL